MVFADSVADTMIAQNSKTDPAQGGTRFLSGGL